MREQLLSENGGPPCRDAFKVALVDQTAASMRKEKGCAHLKLNLSTRALALFFPGKFRLSNYTDPEKRGYQRK